MPYTAIAIAGLPGSGKTTTCKLLEQALGWKYHSIGGILRERHRELRISLPFDDWWPTVSDQELHTLNNKARELLKEGGIILDSRYALANSFDLNSVLNIFITAPLDIRAIRQKSIEDIEIVKKKLERREADEVEKGKALFGHLYKRFDYREMSKYDLTLDTEKLTPRKTRDTIMHFLLSEDF